MNDITNFYPLPQPSFDARYINTNFEIFNDNRLIFVSNPQFVKLNEVILGICNFDCFSDLKKCSNFENLGIAPILDSILTQRNFYPVIPFKIDEENRNKNTIVSLENIKYMNFDIVPDLFIYPNKSMALCFKSEKSKNIFLNPGVVCPDKESKESRHIKGSFTKIFIYPGNNTNSDLINRIKIEKVTIEES